MQNFTKICTRLVVSNQSYQLNRQGTVALWVSASILDALAREEDGSNLCASNFFERSEARWRKRKRDENWTLKVKAH